MSESQQEKYYRRKNERLDRSEPSRQEIREQRQRDREDAERERHNNDVYTGNNYGEGMG